MVNKIITNLVLASALGTGSTSAFATPRVQLLPSAKSPTVHSLLGRRRRWQQRSSSTVVVVVPRSTRVDVAEDAVRDTDYLQEWAANTCGVQQREGLVLFSDDVDWQDVQIATTIDAPAGTCVMYVPSSAFLTSYGSRSEFGRLDGAEKLIGNLAGADQFPLFYLFLKVLVEYERGEDSAWRPWLNSLPRAFNNGAAMTPGCYDCLPPLAAKFCMEERVKYINCKQALKTVDFIDDEVKADDELLKWVYNVVGTRSLEVNGERIIIPMADMFNHVSTGYEVEISYDEEGSCLVYTTTDVPGGSPLRMSYGDYYLTNPSATLAKYGFVDESCPSTYCKMMDIIPSTELRDIGLSFSRMLFYKDTGDVSEEVYDVILHQILSENWQAQREFYNACVTGDADTKEAYHAQYLGRTMAVLKDHVDKFLKELDELYEKASTKDLSKHPRLPLVLAHNDCVRQTFMRVKEKIDPIVAQTMYS